MSESLAGQSLSAKQLTSEQLTPEPTTPAPDPAPAPRQSALLRAGAAVVVAALLGVGIGVGILRTEYPATSPAAQPVVPAATPTAAPTPVFGAKSDGTHFGSMRDLLLPTPAGYRLGPDAGAYGNDTELTEDQRKSYLDDEVHDVPAKLQDAVRKSLQDMHIKGAGVRTFVDTGDNLSLTVWLLQYNEKAVQADNAFADALGSDSGLFRLGPQVPGHNEAHCYLPAAKPGDKIDELECSAAEGDLRVVLRVQGVAPLPKDQAVTIFRQQLDRLAIPGASA